MPVFTIDPLTQLAFSVYENKGVFALLLGSGLSRAASIPTGWEMTLDLIRRVAVARGIAEQADWAAWYWRTAGQEPNYSTLLEELAFSQEERRSILHRYIEPNEQDREENRKIPTAAHHAIADLVRGGYIRVIVTTNFDRLMENALRDRGVEPTVVSSVDALAGAEPITHSACFILKIHGDYKDARILNTEAELGGYPAQYDALLDRILDEHGLIVCGWSGEWDQALRAAFLRALNRRYSVFWAARGSLRSGAEELAKHRRARVIPIADADSFFSTLRQRVETLAASQRQNPMSIELLVNSAKRFLAKAEHRIELEDLFAQQTDRLLTLLDSSDLAPPATWDKEMFRAYVKRYEAATEALTVMCGVLGRWGEGNELTLVLDIIRSLYAHAEKLGSGFPSYLGLRSYPALLIFTSYGLGLTRAGRWPVLHRLFSAMIDQQHRQAVRTIDAFSVGTWRGAERGEWKQLEGLDRRKTPLSDYLLALFSEWGKRFVGLTPDFELVFERFEVLASLAHLERNTKADLQTELTRSGGTFMPMGRSGWQELTANKLIADVQSASMKAALVQAGFGHGDAEFIDLFIQNFGWFATRMRWM